MGATWSHRCPSVVPSSVCLGMSAAAGRDRGSSIPRFTGRCLSAGPRADRLRCERRRRRTASTSGPGASASAFGGNARSTGPAVAAAGKDGPGVEHAEQVEAVGGRGRSRRPPVAAARAPRPPIGAAAGPGRPRPACPRCSGPCGGGSVGGHEHADPAAPGDDAHGSHGAHGIAVTPGRRAERGEVVPPPERAPRRAPSPRRRARAARATRSLGGTVSGTPSVVSR